MKTLRIRHLSGISAWSDVSALQAILGDLPKWDVNAELALSLSGQLERLCVPPHVAQAAFGRRQRRPVPRKPGDLVVELAGELQFLCGEFHGAREALHTLAIGVCHVVIECREFALAEACLHAAVDVLDMLLLGREPHLAETYAALLTTAEEVCPVSSPGLMVSAACDRGIPVFRLGPDRAFCLSPDQVLQFGEGIHQRRLHPWGTMTDRTGFLAGHLANDKHLSKRSGRSMGFQFPRAWSSPTKPTLDWPLPNLLDQWSSSQSMPNADGA